jgi:hypothetical protein
MAAMMFPSLAPTVALYARMTRQRSRLSPLLFTAGYLVPWGAVGVLLVLLARSGSAIAGDTLAWDRAGRWLAGVTLLLAAAYELTPLKDVCLGKCRSPLGFLLGAWRDGRAGALRMGAAHGAWCVGCCWALMASLLALGVMSVSWMAFVAALIAFEKTLPWRRVATYGVTAILLVLGVLLLAAPEAIPALTLPGDSAMGMGSAGVVERRRVPADAAVRELERGVADREPLRNQLLSRAVVARDHAADRLVTRVAILDPDVDVVADAKPLAPAGVLDLDPDRAHRDPLARLPRPGEVLGRVAAQLAGEDRFQRGALLSCGTRVEVEDPTPRSPRLVVAVAERECGRQPGEIDAISRAVRDQP